jgi:hypothetical protein
LIQKIVICSNVNAVKVLRGLLNKNWHKPKVYLSPNKWGDILNFIGSPLKYVMLEMNINRKVRTTGFSKKTTMPRYF